MNEDCVVTQQETDSCRFPDSLDAELGMWLLSKPGTAVRGGGVALCGLMKAALQMDCIPGFVTKPLHNTRKTQ